MIEVTLTSNVKEAENALELALEQGATAIGMKASAYAAKNAPVDTGLLKNSLTYAVSGKQAALKTYRSDDGKKSGSYGGVMPEEKNIAVYIGTNVGYAKKQEYGHRTKAHFIKNAATNHTSEFKKILETSLKATEI